MKRLVETTFANGGTLMVEVDDPDDAPSTRPITRGISMPPAPQVTEKAQSAFEAAMKVVAPTAERLIEELQTLNRMPDLITLTFGLQMTAHAGVVLTSATLQGNFGVTMTWMRSPPTSPLPPPH